MREGADFEQPLPGAKAVPGTAMIFVPLPPADGRAFMEEL
jgi:hypothetical protein